MKLHRYATTYEITTSLDHFDDLLNLIGYLTSPNYLVEVLVDRHSLSRSAAKKRARRITPYVVIALRYLEQARAGPADLAFLPAYYAALNLAKVYILLGPYHSDLKSHRWHGVHYGVHAKDSHSLLTEVLTLKAKGAIPLFYRTITGRHCPVDFRVAMRDVYSYLLDVTAEWQLAGGDLSNLAIVSFGTRRNKSFYWGTATLTPCVPGPLTRRTARVLSTGWRRQPGSNGSTYVRTTRASSRNEIEKDLRKHVRPYLLYSLSQDDILTPLSGRGLLLPEELPILLTFFHMSMVVRYKPEFLETIAKSKHWPTLAAARRHALLRFLTLFWSFVHQRSLFIRSR